MNKFELVTKLILDANLTGHLRDDITYYFDIADMIEAESIKRFYIHKTICEKCGHTIVKIEMGDQVRIKCNCKDGIGKNYDEAYFDWLEK